MIERGSMRPEWCFIADGGRETVGRAALWSLPHDATPSSLVLVDVAWDDDLGVGEDLVRFALGRARALGAIEIQHVLDAPPQWPQWQERPERRVALIHRMGFSLIRETSRFEWTGDRPVPAITGRLTFRSLPDVGEEAFITAIRLVSEATLDRRTEADRAAHGAEAAARADFETESRLRHDERWWELAYTADGDLVGLVMPAENPTSATIAYIGVVPGQRGRGYISDLLARGTATLVEAGVDRIRADTDLRNDPMARAFERAGYERFATRSEYAVDLRGGASAPS